MAGEKKPTFVAASLTAVARRMDYIIETTGPNRGAWVEKLQRECGGKPGDPWCADFVSYVLDVAYFGKSPLKATGSTVEMLADATKKGYTLGPTFAGKPTMPAEDDLYFYMKEDGITPHHVGIVTAPGPFGVKGIAGNTSPDGTSPDGTGVFEHTIPYSPLTMKLVRLPKQFS